METGRKLIIHCDGASRGNPGPAGIGVVVADENGRILRSVDKFIGHATNNQAEYSALIVALEEAHNLAARDVEVHLDSELVVKQVKGEYRVRSADLQPFYQEAMELLRRFARYTILHVPRSQNKGADRLANKAIDGHTLL